MIPHYFFFIRWWKCVAKSSLSLPLYRTSNWLTIITFRKRELKKQSTTQLQSFLTHAQTSCAPIKLGLYCRMLRGVHYGWFSLNVSPRALWVFVRLFVFRWPKFTFFFVLLFTASADWLRFFFGFLADPWLNLVGFTMCCSFCCFC